MLRKNDLVESVEIRVGTILGKHIELLLNHLSILLSKQKKNDFKPKDDVAEIFTGTTVADSCIAFLKKIYGVVGVTLDEENRQMYMSEVGNAFHSLLLEHYKKFGVNTSGGVILTK